MTRSLMIMLAVLALPTVGCTTTEPVRSEQAACAVASARITELRHLPATHVASCEGGLQEDVPGHYVVSLHGHCREEICGSTLMGWFAVRQRDGAVFDFDVGNWKVGRPVREGAA